MYKILETLNFLALHFTSKKLFHAFYFASDYEILVMKDVRYVTDSLNNKT